MVVREWTRRLMGGVVRAVVVRGDMMELECGGRGSDRLRVMMGRRRSDQE